MSKCFDFCRSIRTKHALSRSVLAEEAEIQNAGSAGARMATSNKSGDQHSGLGAQFTSPSAGDSAATAFEMTFQPGASQQQQQQRIVNYALWSSGQCEKASGTQTKQLWRSETGRVPCQRRNAIQSCRRTWLVVCSFFLKLCVELHWISCDRAWCRFFR